jgi:hypothetical protein
MAQPDLLINERQHPSISRPGCATTLNSICSSISRRS